MSLNRKRFPRPKSLLWRPGLEWGWSSFEDVCSRPCTCWVCILWTSSHDGLWVTGLSRGVIWGGWGAVAPKEKEKKKEKKEKRKKRKKKKKKKKERKKGTMNNVKLLHIKCCFFQFFNSPVALENKKFFGPPRKSWKDAPGTEMLI